MARALIARRLKELGLSKVEVSRRLEMNDTYLQQFLSTKKASPRELPERQRIMLAEILKVPEDELRGPGMPISPRKYGQNVAARKNNVVELSPVSYTGVAEHKILVDSNFIGGLDLPVFGTSQVDGENMLSETSVQLAVRPPMLVSVAAAYAVIVPRNSMEPAFRVGSIVMFNPNLQPRMGDLCLFRSLRDGVTYVIGAEYRGETNDVWRAFHYKPCEHSFTLKKLDWQVCHRSVGAYFN